MTNPTTDTMIPDVGSVKRLIGAASETLQPAIEGLTDYQEMSITDGPLGVPTKDSSLLAMERRLKLYGEPYGMRDNASILSVIASSERDPNVEILGLQSLEQASSYHARDGAAAYIGIVARQPWLTGTDTTYTANSLTASGIDFSRLRRGMWVDTTHRLKQQGGQWVTAGPDEGYLAKWGGLITGWDAATNTIYVQQWDRPPIMGDASTGAKAGIPANGIPANLNAQTGIWGANITAQVYGAAPAHAIYGLEITTVNGKADYNPDLHPNPDIGKHSPDNTRVTGVGSYHNGSNTAYAYFDGGGQAGSYYGARVSNVLHAGFAVEGAAQQYAFKDDSTSKIGLLVGQPKQSAGVFALTAVGSGPAFLARGAGQMFVAERADGSDALQFVATSDGIVTILENGVRIIGYTDEKQVLRVEAALGTIFSGLVRASGVQVGEKQVLSSRQPAIPNSDGSAADNTRAINAILSALRAHGLIE